jgi:hypothetical protein
MGEAGHSLRARPPRNYADVADDAFKDLIEHARTHNTFAAFKAVLTLECPKPSVYEEQKENYAKELFMNPAEIAAHNLEFTNFQTLMYSHCRRLVQTSRPERGGLVAPMQLEEVDPWAWKLFLGMDPDSEELLMGKKTLTYEDIDKIIDKISKMTDGDLKTLKEIRRLNRDGFIDHTSNPPPRQRRSIYVDGVHWIIERNKDLPWMIPVSFNYHNPRAVDPKNATTSEMGECGRLVNSNAKLYKKDPYYHNILRLALKLEKNILFQPIEEQVYTSLWHSWQHKCFVWTKPVFKLYAIPYGLLNYNILVGIPKDLAERNKEKILIPKFTVMLPLTGEIRPLDYSIHDYYAAELYRTYDNKGYSRDDPAISNLVYTLDMQGKRPGVGNGGFIANTTCAKKPSFIFAPNNIGCRQGNVISKADFIYKHNTINADRDFTGSNIIEIDGNLRGTAELMHFPHEATPGDILFVPLEWPYGVYQEGEGDYRCHCLTRCIKVEEHHRSLIYMGNEAKFNRATRPELTIKKIEELGDVNKTRMTYIQRYLQNYDRQFPRAVPAAPVSFDMPAGDIMDPETPADEIQDMGKRIIPIDNVSDSVMGIMIRI